MEDHWIAYLNFDFSKFKFCSDTDTATSSISGKNFQN